VLIANVLVSPWVLLCRVHLANFYFFSLTLIFWSISWRPTTPVLCCFRDYPSFLHVWMIFCIRLSGFWELYVPGQRLLWWTHIPRHVLWVKLYFWWLLLWLGFSNEAMSSRHFLWYLESCMYLDKDSYGGGIYPDMSCGLNCTADDFSCNLLDLAMKQCPLGISCDILGECSQPESVQFSRASIC